MPTFLRLRFKHLLLCDSTYSTSPFFCWRSTLICFCFFCLLNLPSSFELFWGAASNDRITPRKFSPWNSQGQQLSRPPSDRFTASKALKGMGWGGGSTCEFINFLKQLLNVIFYLFDLPRVCALALDLKKRLGKKMRTICLTTALCNLSQFLWCKAKAFIKLIVV